MDTFKMMYLLGNRFYIPVTITNKSSSIEAYVRSAGPSSSGSKRVVGLDCSWISSDPNAKVALLQLYNGTECLIVQLLYLEYVPKALKDFLADPSVNFVGLGITEDVFRLERDYGLKCKNPVELGAVATGRSEFDRMILGLEIRKLYEWAESNWADSSLCWQKIVYASTHSYVGYLVGVKLLSCR